VVTGTAISTAVAATVRPATADTEAADMRCNVNNSHGGSRVSSLN
jgi:hypothetical protein